MTEIEFSLVVESFTLDEGGDWERYRAVLAEALAITRREGAGEVLAIDATGLPEVSTLLEAEFPAVRRVTAAGKGYDGGKMEAALMSRGTFVLYLDGDCLPQPGWSAELLPVLRSGAAGAVGGYTRYDGGFLAAVHSVLDFGFMYPLQRRPLQCYASNNAGFRREQLIEVPMDDGGSLRCSCYHHAQQLARRGTPMLLVPEARVLHEMQPVIRERTRQGYDAIAACWDDPALPEARLVRLNVLAIPLFYGMNVLLDWRRAWWGRTPLGLGPFRLLAALPLFPLYRLLDVAGMLRAFVGGRAAGGWQGSLGPPPLRRLGRRARITCAMTQNVDAQPAPQLHGVSLRRILAGRWFALGVTGIALAATAFFLATLTAWPPHEDETLALFTGRDSLLGTIRHVTRERGGAPLHFLLAWGVAHAGFGWRGLRLVSAILAVASIPAMALLGRRLTDGRTALLGTALASGSWLFLFYGTFGRMYSLFLFTTVLAALALLRAVDRGRPRDWALWGVAILAAVASHPYGALVVAAHGLFVLLAHRERLRAAIVAFAVVLVAGTPFWLTDLTLAGRFDVGVGGGGRQLGGPSAVADFAWQVAGDYSTGRHWLLLAILGLAAVGAVNVKWETLALALSLAAVPAISFLGARLHTAAAPQTRHLIFVLPLFSLLVAAGIVRVVRRLPALAVVAVAALLVAEVGWAWHRTPGLLKGEPAARVAARHQASAWLASTSRPDDVLFGYDPIYLGAWERNHGLSRTIVPRADAVLAYKVLTRSTPLGRGVFILDGSDSHNRAPAMTIALRSPKPAAAFEVRRFGPFLVVRTRDATETPQRFLALAEATQRLGRELGLDDSVINLDIVLATERRFS